MVVDDLEKTKKVKKEEQEQESRLLQIIKDDETLDRETRMTFVSMAKLFLENFEDNFNNTSIEMNKKIPLGIDSWKDFLNNPKIRKYIQSFKDEAITQIADAGLLKGDNKSIGIKKAMLDAGPAINNSNIVLIRLPEKEEFE